MRVIDVLKVFNEKADVRRFLFFVLLQVLFTVIGNVLVAQTNTSPLIYWCLNVCLMFMIFSYYIFSSGYLILTMQNILDEKITLPDWFGNIKNIFKQGFKAGVATILQLLLIIVVTVIFVAIISHFFIKNPFYLYMIINLLAICYSVIFLIFDLLNSITIARTNSFASCFKNTIIKNEIIKYFWSFVLVTILSLALIVISNILTFVFYKTIVLGVIYIILSSIVLLFVSLAMARFIGFKHFQVISKNEIAEENHEVTTEEAVEENQEENKGE